MSKMRVAWICHFSNPAIRERLPLSENGRRIPDFAPWVTYLLEEFKNFEEIELHVIAPHPGLQCPSFSFAKDGVQYHFFQSALSFGNRYLDYLFGMIESHSGYLRNRMLVHRILSRISPQLVNLIGAENAYYSSAVLGIRSIPVLISIQGIYSNDERFKLVQKDPVRYRTERKIHRANKYYGINAGFMTDLIRRDALDPVLFWNRYPLKILKLEHPQGIEKQYDFVFFGRLETIKGPDDALEALALVKRDWPDVTMRMMGPAGSASALELLREKARQLGLEENLELSGGYPLQEDMLREAAKGSYYVLPTKLDTIPCTILEAIYLDLPVVSYRTGDIPLLNTGEERVLLCDKGDIASLAANMGRLLADRQLGPRLSQKARCFVERWFDNRKVARNLLDQYQAVYRHYHENEPIPEHLLYENYLKQLGKP